jgi:hypothetical protein
LTTTKQERMRFAHMEKFEKIAGRNPMLSVFRRCCGAAMNLATSHCRHDWRNF